MYSWVGDDGKGRGMWEISVPPLQFCHEIYLKINWGMVLSLLSTAPVDFPQASPSVISSHHGTKIAPFQQTSLPVDNENVPYFPQTTYQNYKSLFYYLDCRPLICSSSDSLAFRSDFFCTSWLFNFSHILSSLIL